MMLPTSEVRWFFRGDVPPRVADWIRRGSLWVQQPERVDEYLAIPSCRSASIKLREGRFEVKMQTEAPTARHYAAAVSGYRDGWIKWSREVGDSAPDHGFWSAAGERWIAVRKRRVVRGFSLDGVAAGALPHEVAVDGERRARGGDVEVTRVDVGTGEAAESWWTLGLEGFDADGDPAAALEQIAGAIFEREPPPIRLRLADSRAYAAWLATGRGASGQETAGQ